MSGGHSRLKPSPGSFLVASMPNLVPMANSVGGVVKDVGGAAGENGVALRIGGGAEAEEHFAGVMDVNIVVHAQRCIW